MKKTYIAPEMEMIDIKLENMIAASVFKDAVDPKDSEIKEFFETGIKLCNSLILLFDCATFV